MSERVIFFVWRTVQWRISATQYLFKVKAMTRIEFVSIRYMGRDITLIDYKI